MGLWSGCDVGDADVVLIFPRSKTLFLQHGESLGF